MIRLRTLMIPVIVAGAVAAPVGADAHYETLPRGPACDRGTRVLRSPEASVRRTGKLVFGCVTGARRGRALERTGCITGLSTSLPRCVTFTRPALAGRWVAYATRVEQYDLDAWLDTSSVSLVDLRRGRRWTIDACPGSWSETSADQNVTYFSGAVVRRLLVTSTGTAVFAARDRREPAKGNLICLAQASARNSVVLAQSPGIDVASLQLTGTSVSWRDAGVSQTVPLPGGAGPRP